MTLLTRWYERNLAICDLCSAAAEGPPNARVVVFYGQGHIHLLQQCLRGQPGVQLVPPTSYLMGT